MRPAPNRHGAPPRIRNPLAPLDQRPQVAEPRRPVRVRKHHVRAPRVPHPVRHRPALPPVRLQLHHADAPLRDALLVLEVVPPGARHALAVRARLVLAHKLERLGDRPVRRPVAHDEDLPAAHAAAFLLLSSFTSWVRFLEVVDGFFEHPG